MSDVVITVASKVPPSAANKPGRIVDTTGKQWDAWEAYPNLIEGQSYILKKIKTRQWNNKTFFTIIEAMPMVSAPQTGVPPGTFIPTPPPMPPYTKDEMIFVCGGLNNILSNPNTDPGQLKAENVIEYVNGLRRAWRNTFGKTQQSAEMNDEIPYA